MSSDTPSVYYRHSSLVPGASQLSWRVRSRIFGIFLDVMQPTSSSSVLDVGVTDDVTALESNFFEQLYPHKERLTCASIEDASHLERLYSGVQFRSLVSGKALPFSDRSFDIVFCNAVVEHVGSSERQRAFVGELCRVGVSVFIATPNRWFPVELHTGVPLLHLLPKRFHRATLARTRLSHWASEDHLNLLTLAELTGLFPADRTPVSMRVGLGWGHWRSNLIAYTPIDGRRG